MDSIFVHNIPDEVDWCWSVSDFERDHCQRVHDHFDDLPPCSTNFRYHGDGSTTLFFLNTGQNANFRLITPVNRGREGKESLPLSTFYHPWPLQLHRLPAYFKYLAH